jgi:transcription elongation factor Elf1
MSREIYVGELRKAGDVAYVWCPYCQAACVTECLEVKDGVYVLKCKMCDGVHETAQPRYYIQPR